MTILEAEALTKTYHERTPEEVRALHSVTLRVEPGNFVVVTGPSGAGKTTLMMLLALLEQPTAGHVLFKGVNLNECSDVERARARRKMGVVFQDFALIAHLAAWENVTYPLVPRGLSKTERFLIAERLFAQLGLEDKLMQCPKDMSGGEQQRVAIARALAGAPDIILADEPTSNLDSQASELVRHIFSDLRAKGTSIVVVSHDPIWIGCADQRLELECGKSRHGAVNRDAQP